MEQALTKVAGDAVQVLFTPHLVPTTRGILATCYARPRPRADLRPRACSSTTASSTRDDPCVVVVDEPSGTKATYGANVAHVTVRFDDRTDTVVAIAAEDNLVKGASGQMIQAANLLLGLPETDRPPARSGSSRERHRGAGVRGGRARVRHQGVGRARPRAGRDRRPARR